MPLLACLAQLTAQLNPKHRSHQLSPCGEEGDDFSKKCFGVTGIALGLAEHTDLLVS